MLTDFLKLFKPDMPADGTKTFNVKTMLSDNWDKIEAFAKGVNERFISKEVITAANTFLIGSGAGSVETKTVSEVKDMLGMTALVSLPVTAGTVPTFTASSEGFGLNAGQKITIKFHAASNAASTLNINNLGAKALKKADGSNFISIKANGIYTFVYDGVNFQLQGEGASGNATASDLLSGKTASTDAGDIVGTLALTGNAPNGMVVDGYTFYNVDPKVKVTGALPNRGSVNITPGASNQPIPHGFHSGSGIVLGSPNLMASNIRSGVNIFGVQKSLVSENIFKSTQSGYCGVNPFATQTGSFKIPNVNFTVKQVFAKMSFSGYAESSTDMERNCTCVVSSGSYLTQGALFYGWSRGFDISIGYSQSGTEVTINISIRHFAISGGGAGNASISDVVLI